MSASLNEKISLEATICILIRNLLMIAHCIALKKRLSRNISNYLSI